MRLIRLKTLLGDSLSLLFCIYDTHGISCIKICFPPQLWVGCVFQVITLEKFEHLALLLRVGDATTDMLPLNQATPFFANSDPAMPAVPVPLPQVLDWMLEHLCAASDPNTKSLTKANGSRGSEKPEADVPMPDASPYGGQPSGTISNGLTQLPSDWQPEGIMFVDGVTKASIVKREADIKGGSVKVGLVM
jgi:TBCC domain-containing protein 1